MDPMIRARCQSCGQPEGRVRNYVRRVEPLGYPNDAVICYMRGCENHAVIWLDEVAASQYDKGIRLFMLMGSAARIKLQ
jgi:hypothetical protein